MWYKRPYNFFIYSSLMIIVTGGAGFIGSNIVAALEKAGKKDLVVVDELGSSDKWKNIAKRELCAVIPPEDMLDYMEAHAEEIEAVIHMGAISATAELGITLSAFQIMRWLFYPYLLLISSLIAIFFTKEKD